MNYNFGIRSVKNIDIGYETIVTSNNSEFDTAIDMTSQGMHIDKGLLQYLELNFLDFLCDKNDTYVMSDDL